jgi:hypothetical protein
VKRGRPPTATPTDSTERSRKSRARAVEEDAQELEKLLQRAPFEIAMEFWKGWLRPELSPFMLFPPDDERKWGDTRSMAESIVKRRRQRRRQRQRKSRD